MAKLRYKFDTLTVARFRDLLARAGLSVQQFMFLTGRHGYDVANFLADKPKLKWEPMISEIVLLELAARTPGMADTMIAIATEYAPKGE